MLATARTLAGSSGFETDLDAQEAADSWLRNHPHHRVEIDWYSRERCWIVRTINAAGALRFLRQA